jgi:hypothetical protein
VQGISRAEPLASLWNPDESCPENRAVLGRMIVDFSNGHRWRPPRAEMALQAFRISL